VSDVGLGVGDGINEFLVARGSLRPSGPSVPLKWLWAIRSLLLQATPFSVPLMANGVDDDHFHSGRFAGLDGFDVSFRRERRLQGDNVIGAEVAVKICAAVFLYRSPRPYPVAGDALAVSNALNVFPDPLGPNSPSGSSLVSLRGTENKILHSGLKLL